MLLGVGTAAYTTAALPLFVQMTPAGMLAPFQALLGFAQEAAVLVALPALGWIAAATGVRGALAVVGGDRARKRGTPAAVGDRVPRTRPLASADAGTSRARAEHSVPGERAGGGARYPR